MAIDERAPHRAPQPGSGFRPRTRVEYVLRVGDEQVPMDRPRIVIGRSATADIKFDGPLVSRLHAAVSLTERGLCLEDLASRNGVFVNGVLVRQPFPLEPGDRIRVGDHDVDVVYVGGLEPQTDELDLDDLVEDELSTRRVDPLELLGGAVKHALAIGDAEEAESMLGGHLRVLLREAKSGRSVSPKVFRAAVGYGLDLAGATGSGEWVDYVLDLHLSARQLMALSTIRDLFRLAPVTRYRDGQILRRYSELLATQGASFGPDAPVVLERMQRYGRL